MVINLIILGQLLPMIKTKGINILVKTCLTN